MRAWSSGRLNALLGLGAVALSTLSSCADLPVISQNTCGNKVLDGGEDCDTFLPRDLPNAQCGTPGEKGECRYLCNPKLADSPIRCPENFACGQDGICRTPRGDFSNLGVEIVEAGVTGLDLADLNGDGRADLIARTHLDNDGEEFPYYVWFDADGKPATHLQVDAAFSFGGAQDLDGDGMSDVLFHIREGVGVQLGTAKHELRPSILTFVAVNSNIPPKIFSYATGGAPPRTTGYAAALADKSVVILPSPVNGANDRGFELKDGRSARHWVGPTLAADVFVGAQSPGEELPMGYANRSNIDIYRLNRDPKGDYVDVGGLPQGVFSASRVVAGDVTGDGKPELFLRGTDGKNYMAYQCDTGFCGSADGSQPSVFRPFFVAESAAQCAPGSVLALGEPLAMGDLTRDGLGDMVFSGAVFSVRSVVPATEGDCLVAKKLYSNSARTWDQARIAEIDRDGYLDVVAASRSDSGIDVLRAGAGDTLVLARVLTESPVSQLAIGDFDIDLINDIAFSAVAPDQSGSNTRYDLHIAFGQPFAGPSPSVEYGHTGQLAGMASTSLGGTDAQLGMTLLDAISGGRFVSILQGEGGRQLYSPTAVGGVDGMGGSLPQPVRTVIVNGPTPSVATLVATPDCSANGACGVDWVVASVTSPEPSAIEIKAGSLMNNFESSPFQVKGSAADTGISNLTMIAQIAAINAQGKGQDDVFVLAPLRDNSEQMGIWERKVVEGQPTVNFQPVVTLDLRFSPRVRPFGADLNGDGAEELIFATETPASDGMGYVRQLSIIWSKPNTGLDPATLEHHRLESRASHSVEVVATVPGVMDIKPFEQDQDGRPELAVVGTTGTFVLDWEPEDGIRLSAVAGLGAASQVATGDTNGDGLDDLVVANPNGVFSYAALAVRP